MDNSEDNLSLPKSHELGISSSPHQQEETGHTQAASRDSMTPDSICVEDIMTSPGPSPTFVDRLSVTQLSQLLHRCERLAEESQRSLNSSLSDTQQQVLHQVRSVDVRGQTVNFRILPALKTHEAAGVEKGSKISLDDVTRKEKPGERSVL